MTRLVSAMASQGLIRMFIPPRSFREPISIRHTAPARNPRVSPCPARTEWRLNGHFPTQASQPPSTVRQLPVV